MVSSDDRPQVLIVEDDISYQELYTELFERDYLVEIFGNKEEAIVALRDRARKSNPFDVALIDMRLNDEESNNTDGLDVAALIFDLNVPTKVILKSGYPTDELVQGRVASLPLFAILQKNSNYNQTEELMAAVIRAVSQLR